MRYIYLLTLLLAVASCSRKADCWNPPIYLNYYCDSGYIAFNFKTYEKGTGFTKLISNEPDTAIYRNHINLGAGIFPANDAHGTIYNAAYDYMIEIIATGKTYKIADISYDGKDKVRYGSVISEDEAISCTHNMYYKLNDTQYSVSGGQYHRYGGSSYKKAEIYITR